MVVSDLSDQRHAEFGQPSALFEITTDATHCIDHGEKLLVHRRLPGLDYYVRIEHCCPEAIVDYLTPDGWKREQLNGLNGIIRLPSLEIELPMAELYERVVFPV